MKKSILVNPDEIQMYIKDLRKIPVMSHQRQEEICELLKNKKITKEEKKVLFDELVGNLVTNNEIVRCFKIREWICWILFQKVTLV